MIFNKMPKKCLITSLVLLICLSFSFANKSFAQDTTLAELTAEARKMVNENRYIDALPLLEQIILSYPNSAEMWADFGIAIVSHATTITDAAERKKEMDRGIKALQRAKQLGTTNTRALYFLDQFEDFDGTDNFSNSNPEVERALREGEAFFGRGEYDEAFKSYERASILDPKNYEAVLFMGDCFYAQKKYAEAEIYFAKAIAIEPEKETAYRFWGDALLYQNKPTEALDKFLDGLIRDPFSRLSWDSLRRWADKTDSNFEIIEIIPPGGESLGRVKINESLLKAHDGTDRWKLYNEVIKEQMSKRIAAKQNFSLSDETMAWKKVADAFRQDIKSGKIKYPDRHLVNLLRLDDKNLIEPYILLLRPHDTFEDDFIAYRKQNPQKIKQFVQEFILNLKG
jgi:tetratricopeptide (TPR) repeat protein